MWKSIVNIFKSILCLWMSWQFVTNPGGVSDILIQIFGVLFLFTAIDYFFNFLTPIMDRRLEKLKLEKKNLEIIAAIQMKKAENKEKL